MNCLNCGQAKYRHKGHGLVCPDDEKSRPKSHWQAPTGRLADKRVYPSQAIDGRYGGLTLREHYAGLIFSEVLADYQALDALMGERGYDHPQAFKERAEAVSRLAVGFAEALCAELERSRG